MALSDPFLAALAEAEYDDEPYMDEQRAAAQEGREAFRRGEFSTLEEVWRELMEEKVSSYGEGCEDCEDCEGYET